MNIKLITDTIRDLADYLDHRFGKTETVYIAPQLPAQVNH